MILKNILGDHESTTLFLGEIVYGDGCKVWKCIDGVSQDITDTNVYGKFNSNSASLYQYQQEDEIFSKKLN